MRRRLGSFCHKPRTSCSASAPCPPSLPFLRFISFRERELPQSLPCFPTRVKLPPLSSSLDSAALLSRAAGSALLPPRILVLACSLRSSSSTASIACSAKEAKACAFLSCSFSPELRALTLLSSFSALTSASSALCWAL